MKLTLLAALVLFQSVSALASTATYQVSRPSIVASQPNVHAGDEAYCPQIAGAYVETFDATLEVKSFQLNMGGSYWVPFNSSGPVRSCISDVVCNTSDQFVIDQNTSVSVMRNNDGQYPTTDLPGHNSLSITSTNFSPDGRSLTCYYQLN